MALIPLAHKIISDHFNDQVKTLAVDATIGNGHDIEFLLKQNFKKVVGFDVQAQAITATEHRLKAAKLLNYQLIKDGHQNIHRHINETIQCCIFNFGYLPKADKSVTTRAETSILAIHCAIELLDRNGLISLICYPGHEQGAIETKAIQQTLDSLTDSLTVKQYLDDKPQPQAPILYTITNA